VVAVDPVMWHDCSYPFPSRLTF